MLIKLQARPADSTTIMALVPKARNWTPKWVRIHLHSSCIKPTKYHQLRCRNHISRRTMTCWDQIVYIRYLLKTDLKAHWILLAQHLLWSRMHLTSQAPRIISRETQWTLFWKMWLPCLMLIHRWERKTTTSYNKSSRNTCSISHCQELVQKRPITQLIYANKIGLPTGANWERLRVTKEVLLSFRIHIINNNWTSTQSTTTTAATSTSVLISLRPQICMEGIIPWATRM